MHPEIKAYWENFYNKSIQNDGNMFFIPGEDNKTRILAMTGKSFNILDKNTINKKFKDDEIVYFMQGAHTEEVMLRLLKLKAFI